jgi:ribosomal protein L11 methyltransferase
LTWLGVELEIPSAAVAAIEEALGDLGALSVSLADPGAEPILEPGPGATPLWGTVVLTALLPAGTSEQAVRDRLGPLLPRPAPALRFAPLAARDWVREFRENLAPLRFGTNLWICPEGTACPDPAGVSIVLEPGLAFGSGSHATTALCLEWLAAQRPARLSVLDWGCGSGILAIAALALGARAATALDIDPQALAATADNATRNGVAGRLRVTLPDGIGSGERYDLLLANILANTLIGLAPVLHRHCAAGARIALSGILTTQAARVREACAPWFALDLAGERAGWALLAGTPVVSAPGT